MDPNSPHLLNPLPLIIDLRHVIRRRAADVPLRPGGGPGGKHIHNLLSSINTKNILRNELLWLGNIDHNTKIECPILEDEIGLTSDSVKPWSMVITDHDRQLNSAIERQQGYPIESLPGHDSLIIDNSSIGIKFGLNGLISLVGFAGLGYGPNSHLSRDAKHFPNITINNLLQFDFVGCMEFKSLFPHVIAGGVELMHSLKERTVIFSRGI